MKIRSIVIMAVLLTAVFGFGFSAQAQTDVQAMIAQLQAQIASLMAQLKALQAQQGTTQTWCHTFNTNLGYANAGSSEVGYLHSALGKEGISYSSDAGNAYGEPTMSAIIQFQQKYGITQTGYVGPLTRAKLNSLYGCSATATQTPTSNQVSTLTPAPTPTPVAISTAPQTANQVVGRTNCTPNWVCAWGSCTNGIQQNLPTDTNMCMAVWANQISCPSLTRTCSSDGSTPPGPSSSDAVVTIISPSSGEQIAEGATYKIRWNLINGNNLINGSTVASQPITVGLKKCPVNSSATCAFYQIGWGPEGLMFYPWTVPFTWSSDELSNSYFQIFIVKGTVTSSDISDNNNIAISARFSIAYANPVTGNPKYILITSPSAGETWNVGETHNITWQSKGVDNAHINLRAGGICPLATVPASQGSWAFTVANPITCHYDAPTGDLKTYFASGSYAVQITSNPSSWNAGVLTLSAALDETGAFNINIPGSDLTDDVNHNDSLDVRDLNLMTGCVNGTEVNYNCLNTSDLNKDGKVDSSDMAIFQQHWPQ